MTHDEAIKVLIKTCEDLISAVKKLQEENRQIKNDYEIAINESNSLKAAYATKVDSLNNTHANTE